MRLYEGSLELAEASLVEATRLNPYHTMALMWLGNVLQEQGRISDAHDPYSRAYALDPEHPTVAENFVNSLLLRGDNAQARAVLAGAQQSLGLLKLAAMTALESMDDQNGLERWRTQGLQWLAETTASGWGSFDYRLQEAYFLSAAGHVEQSLATFFEVTKLGVFPRQALQSDPRAANILMAGSSLHELIAGDQKTTPAS